MGREQEGPHLLGWIFVVIVRAKEANRNDDLVNKVQDWDSRYLGFNFQPSYRPV